MDFGRAPREQLGSIDFSLPPDPKENISVSEQHTGKGEFRFYFGSTKWSYPEWVGTWYPKGTKSAQFLEQYAQVFTSIELNTTYYRMPTFQQTSGWRGKVGPGFKFCPKFVDQITHIRRLKNVKDLVDEFLDGISGFGDNLGPVLFMPHPGMGPAALEAITQFIESLPADFSVALELRHPEWFTHTSRWNELMKVLEMRKQPMVITDVAGRRDCLHMRLTSGETMIRFVGNDLHPSDYTRIDHWVERLKIWKSQGLQSVYFFVHQHDEDHVPELAHYLVSKINQQLSLTIPLPQNQQPRTLF